jgi:Protein of unknown function (DUF4038)/Domain of unknown function (DUF5060)/Putative collagen-binding domain of a collagenase
MKALLRAILLLTLAEITFADDVELQAPRSVLRFDPAEFVLTLKRIPFRNPFTEIELTGDFTPSRDGTIRVLGFADAQDGRTFRLRFSPDRCGVTYHYKLRLRGSGIDRSFSGEFHCEPSTNPGPAIVDPKYPKHFTFAGSKKPFYHLGYTAYHLLDPSNDDAQLDATIDYCAKHGFNKIRFLLTGYPRDLDKRTSADVEHGVPDPWKAPNYGARPGQVNPLPAWLGTPHQYDFTRFNVAYWQRVDRAVRRMRERGIVATAIITIEKQDLPHEYGRLSDHELRLYRYAVARLAAFDSVWWDLGNEHNEFRDISWGNAVGAVMKAIDPYKRLTSAHAYADFLYAKSDWADFVITQQYGDERQVHDWVLKYQAVGKPYVNEEYGYEGNLDKPGHAQNNDWVRRCHWAIALAGGYATYGDWSDGVSYYYMGEPGPGKTAPQLKHLRTFFESLPFHEMIPRDQWTSRGFCLAKANEHYVFYLPWGGTTDVNLEAAGPLGLARWFDPRTGNWRQGPRLVPGRNTVTAPAGEDWVLYVRSIETR